ncbi:phospholysine phosphohistidine inorganic pyrophosphate phosphatase-like [Bolinopsis microptera]|uniref:phospholysine phosphohistidine inorganic pyrophosphate phosphatase-like n=1 Tax=Bolinopsis microptera TaxID=2820187 RepID=UPI00307AC546
MLSERPKGIVSDISGVLKDMTNGVDVAIEKSVEAFQRIQESGVPYVLCTNESCYSTAILAQKLNEIGFNVRADQILSPVSAIIQVIKENNHRPFVLVNKKVVEDFSQFDQTNPDCVVVGDAEEHFTYEIVNKTFKLLVGGERKFYSLGKGKYYMDSGELKVDLGCFVAGLEYSSQVQAEIVGKPSSVFFNQAAKMIGLAPGDLVMIGDDVEGDVGGALSAGFQAAVLVKTGKFRPRDANHPKVKPTFIADNLSHAVDVILGMK